MANGYSQRDMLLRGAQVAVGASETDTVVTNTFAMSPEDSKFCLIRIVCTSVTVTNAISAELEHSWDGGTTWLTLGTDDDVSISGNGTFEIEHNHENTNSQLTWPLCRVTVTSGVSDAVDVDAVYVTRRY
jgi:hypothetical protein